MCVFKISNISSIIKHIVRVIQTAHKKERESEYMKKERNKETGENQANKSRSFLKEMKTNFVLYLMMLPTIVFLLINNYLPIAGLSLAFLKFRPAIGFFKSKFIGIENFKFFFATPDFITITRNTIAYNSVYIVLDILVAVICAIALNEMRKKLAKRAFQSFMLMPFFLSWVVINFIFYSFLSVDRGFINTKVLEFLNMQPVQWYRNVKAWPFILVFAQLWRYTGYNTILIYAGLMGIDETMYEAAVVDGASKWKQMTHITLPQLMPVIIIMFLMLVGRIFYADFGLHFQVPNGSGALFPVTDVLDTYVYRSLRQMGNISMAAAAGFYQAVVGMIIVVVANKVVTRIDPTKSLF